MNFDPTLAASLAAQAKEDDERMTPGPWERVVDKSGQRFGDGTPVCFIETDHEDPNAFIAYDVCEDDAEAIARTRNNLAAMSEQLTAAVAEVERLRAELDLNERQLLAVEEGAYNDAVHLRGVNKDLRGERDAALAKCEGLKAENERMRTTFAVVAEAVGFSWSDLGSLALEVGDVIDEDDKRLYERHVEEQGKAVAAIRAHVAAIMSDVQTERDMFHALLCVVALMDPTDRTTTVKVFLDSMPSLAPLFREGDGRALYLCTAVERALDYAAKVTP